MPVTLVQSKWDSGTLVFHDKDDYGASAEILRISQAAVIIGTSTNSVAFSTSGAILPVASNTPALGSTSFMWADLFLGSGAVINFNTGDITMTHQTNIITFASSVASSSRSDGFGFFEFDVTMTGTATGHFAATSAWVNIGSGVTPASGGETITPRTDGIFEDAGATLSGARLAFGARMQAILGDSNFERLTIWSLNTNQTITAIYDAATPGDYIGFTPGSPTGSGTGSIPFFIDSNGDIKYIRVYNNTS